MESVGPIVVGFIASLIGSMVGIGGGIIIVPALTLLMGYDIKHAIAASLLSIVATSTMANAIYTSKKWVHYPLGFVLVVGTLAGAFVGSHVAVGSSSGILYLVFAAFLFLPAYFLLKPQGKSSGIVPVPKDAEWRWFMGEFSEDAKDVARYVIQKTRLQMVLLTLSGLFSGLLGIGGGLLNVPVMNQVGRIPFKVAAATSTLIMGFTALMGSIVFFYSGTTDAALNGRVVLGSVVGAFLGPYASSKVQSRWLARLLVVLILVSATRMLMQAWKTL